MWFGFQFNLSDSSDDDLYRLDLDQWKMISLYSWDHILVHPKKSSRGCLRVRPDSDSAAALLVRDSLIILRKMP